MIYVEIAVNVPQVAGVFHYHLPPRLAGSVQPGHLVEVPFGRMRVQGVVLRTVPEPEVRETRPVAGLVDPDLVLTPAQISLAKELAGETLSPLAVCIGLMLPPGLTQEADVQYLLAGSNPDAVDSIQNEGKTSDSPVTHIQLSKFNLKLPPVFPISSSS